MYTISAGVRSTSNEDGGTVLDINRGKIFRLNRIGALIFEQLRQPRTRTQIVNEIGQNFKISPEMIEADVIAFLESLQRRGLIHDLAEASR